MYRISFSENQFSIAAKTFPDEEEEMVYCLAYPSAKKALVKHILKPTIEEMKRDLWYVEPTAGFECKMLNLLRKEPAPIVIRAHWHKFTDEAWFSDSALHEIRKPASPLRFRRPIFLICPPVLKALSCLCF